MNLVEISEMLKGAPDTYLTKHVQAPDGSVPQYLALAELQRRQDMRARFAQQSPGTTVADDVTKGMAPPEMAQGIAAGAPPMAAPGIPPMPGAPMTGAPMPGAPMAAEAPAPQPGFAEGGMVGVDGPLDHFMKTLGIRNLPSEKLAYERGVRRAEGRANEFERSTGGMYRKHMRNMLQAEDRLRSNVRERMLPPPASANSIDSYFASQAAKLSPAEVDAGYKQFLDRQAARLAEEKLRDAQSPALPVGTDLNKIFAPVPEGGAYKDGGLVDKYIEKAGKFESGNNRNAKNPFSTASGRYQFIDSTRRALDKKYGFDPKDRSDKTEAARMKAYTQETIDALEKSNIPVTGGTLYGGHFLGQKGITDFFAAYQKDPNTKVEDFFSAKIIQKNPAIFNPKKGKPRRTLAEVMEKFDQVGGGKVKTPMTTEDMNLGAAMQVAQRADRGDVGAYEDMNMGSALALAKDLEGKAKGKPQPSRQYAAAPEPNSPSNMALLQLLSETKAPAPTSQPTFFYSPADNPIDEQIRAQLLEPYAMPQAGPGIQGFYEGGPVIGLTGEVMDPYLEEQMRKMAEKRRAEKLGKDYATQGEAAKRAIGGLAAFIKNPMAPETYLPSSVVGGINYATKLATDPLGPVQTVRREAQWAMPEVGAQVKKQIEEITGTPGAPLFTAAGQLNIAPPKPPEAPKEDPYDVLARQFLDDVKKNQMSKEDMRSMALLQAGLGMMAGESPNFATNVGRGAMAGLQSYQQAQAQNRDLAEQAMGNMMKARALGLDARRVQSAEDTAKAQAEYQRSMIDYNKARAQAFLERAKLGGGVSREQEITYRAAVEKLLEAEGMTGQITEERFNQILDMVRRGLMNYGIKGSPDMGDFEEGPNVSDTAE